MALDEKRNETRPMACNYRGDLAIHAATKFPELSWELCFTKPFIDVLTAHHIGHPNDLPLGAIVAVVEVYACLPTEHREAAQNLFELPYELAFGNYQRGRYIWVTRNVRPLKKPFACRGMQGLWPVSSLFEAEIRKQLP